MQDAGQRDPEVAARVQLFQYRVVEELYDFENDPDALVNLVDHPDHQDQLNRLREELEAWMIEHDDPALDAFRNRHNPAALATFMREQDMRSRKLAD